MSFNDKHKGFRILVTHHVSTQINAKNGDSSEWKRNVKQNEQQEWRNLRNIWSQSVRNGFFQVVENETSWKRQNTQKNISPYTFINYVIMNEVLYNMFNSFFYLPQHQWQ